MGMSGSEIAIGGFKNEEDVVMKFNNWQNDEDAKKWLKVMMYNLEEIESVKAERIGQKGYKSDVNVTINIVIKSKKMLTSVENIQVKLVSNDKGFNQVEKKKVDSYALQWHMDEEIIRLLKLYDGETAPTKPGRSEKRIYADEFTKEEQQYLIDFFQKNLIMIIGDVIRGRGRFAAEWTLVINKSNGYRWKLMSINEAVGIYADDCKAWITPKGNIRLGKITLQRKGGDNGADTANMLQFKADPMILFD